MAYFTGEILQPPALRFNASSPSARHYNARQGLKTYGPYDSATLGKGRVACAIVYPTSLQRARETLVSGLIQGNGSFSGFKSLFKIPLEICWERVLTAETALQIQQTCRTLVCEKDLDLAFILASTRDEQFYPAAKAELLGNGIPSQVVTAEKLCLSNQLPWTLENIALQTYAKVGGTPWVVSALDKRREVVIGISRAQDRQRNFAVGFVTLFTHDGDFLFLHSMAPQPTSATGWEREEYVASLSKLIVEAYEEYASRRGQPQSIVLHLCKRPGRFREVEAVQQALHEIGGNIPYALLHLNDNSNYRLFDASHFTYVPLSGLKAKLGDRHVLLLLDGRVGDQRRRRGVPRVLDISMDSRSTMPVAEFPRLAHQIFDFARVNWRGFNARAVPATLNYSYLVARLVVEIGANRWNAIASAGRLRDKAWFL